MVRGLGWPMIRGDVSLEEGSGSRPVNTVAPVASGTVTIGGTLSCTTGTWTGVPAPTFAYQWQRAGVNIAAATASTYTPAAADIGPAITCNVTATGLGSATASSNALTWAVPSGRTLLLMDTGISGSPIDTWANAGSAAGSFSGTTTARPTAVTIDAHTCAQFDGSNDRMTGGPALSALFSASAYSVLAIIKPIALTGAAGGIGWNMRGAFTDNVNGDMWPLNFNGSGYCAGHWDGTTNTATAEIGVSTGTVYYFETVFGSGTVTARANATTKTASRGNVSDRTGLSSLGANFNASVFLNATVCEVWGFNVALTAGQLADCQAYLLNRFPSAVAAY